MRKQKQRVQQLSLNTGDQPQAALGQLAGWLLPDHTADISTGAGWVRKQELKAV